MNALHSYRNIGTGIEGKPLASARTLIAAQAPGFAHSLRRIARGATLYGFGDPCRALYVVRQGSLKSLTVTDDGLTQVVGFPTTGDVVGLDGIDSGAHQNEAIALEDCELVVLPYAQVTAASSEPDDTRPMILRAIAREIVRCQRLAVMLGSMRAEQRVAIFLVDLAELHGRLGGSRIELVLRMRRRDIASYLGLKIETVSRVFSHLQHKGIIAAEGKLVHVLDAKALEAVSGVVTRREPGDAARRAHPHAS